MASEEPGEWRAAVGYEGRYEVSSTGGVRNVRTGRDLKAAGTRYPTVHLSTGTNSSRKTWTIHTLVARAFIGEPTEAKPLVRHLDGNPFNNDIANLAYGDHSDNAKDSVRHGTCYFSKAQPPRAPKAHGTHCKNGHEQNEENVTIWSNGQRVCKPCHRDWARTRSERNKDQA